MAMMMKALGVSAGLILAAVSAAFGQAPRLADHNALGWVVYGGDHQLSEK